MTLPLSKHLPYTTAPGDPGSDDEVHYEGNPTPVLGEGHTPAQLATLLNDAYAKGVEAERARYTAIGMKHTHDRCTHIWLGHPKEDSAIYALTSELRPDSAHLAHSPNPPTVRPV